MNTKEETLALADIFKLRELEATAHRENNKLALAIYEILDNQLNDLLDAIEAKGDGIAKLEERIKELETVNREYEDCIAKLERENDELYDQLQAVKTL